MYPRYLNELSTGSLTIPLLVVGTRASHVTPHRHDFLELQVILDGHGTEYVNGKPHRLEPGSVTFLLPYQIHELHAEPGQSLHICNCNFDMSLLFDGNGPLSGLSGLLAETDVLPSHLRLHGEEKQQMDSLVHSLLREYAGEAKWKAVQLKALLFQALVLFDRVRSESAAAAVRPVAGAAAAEQVQSQNNLWPVVHYMHEHYRDDLGLQQLANHFHMNAKHLSALMIKRLGQNFVSFLHELRIRHACSLLRSTDLPITSIALETGFGSFQTFSRCFAKLKGMTPSQYRRAQTLATSSQAPGHSSQQ
ncbi:AraC family transcriptional regulator [Paenibacillus koleovorans]|uniref:AraC family transcriptional regulator n=1 Tax=Paenibacillus koleovorans TaxID=121608 RepID=UPI000FDC6041|nr:AraC family transcriptional regulator [Paenibacillus koleovorans]